MEIRLNTPHTFLEFHIDKAATDAGCLARFKWLMPQGARFILVDRPMSDKQATFEQHDKVIKALLVEHPDARVRTALGTFHGLVDWEALSNARVPA